ncbi:hypothetical protein DFS34DRAFT_277907 [Phlyctochytrium arcticum]|nr:hypothetical protein DFS34DRAFT_277907 [Phlyctochytrium arcticum]
MPMSLILFSSFETEIGPEDILQYYQTSHLDRLLSNTDVARSRSAKSSGVFDVVREPIDVSLADLTWPGLGTLLMGLYGQFMKSDGKKEQTQSSHNLPLRIQIENKESEVEKMAIDETESRPASESADLTNMETDAAAVPDDGHGEPVDPIPESVVSPESLCETAAEPGTEQVSASVQDHELAAADCLADPSPDCRKRKHVNTEAEDLRRVSKRVRDRGADQQQHQNHQHANQASSAYQEDSLDLSDILQGCLPDDWSLSSTSEQVRRLIPDPERFYAYVRARILAPTVAGDGRSRGKGGRKADGKELGSMTIIQPTSMQVPSSTTTQDLADPFMASDTVMSFVGHITVSQAGILDCIRAYIVHVCFGVMDPREMEIPDSHAQQECRVAHWTPALRHQIVAMVLSLERVDSGLEFWRRIHGLDGDDGETRGWLLQLLLALGEILSDTAARSDLEAAELVPDGDSDNSHPLETISLRQVLWRYVDAISDMLANSSRSPDDDDIYDDLRCTWLKGRTWEQEQQFGLAATQFQMCLGLLADREWVIPYSGTENVLTPTVIQSKLVGLQARQFVLDAVHRYEEGEFDAVTESLGRVVVLGNSGTSTEDDTISIARTFLFESCPYTKRTQLIESLRQSYIRKQQNDGAFICAVHLLMDTLTHFHSPDEPFEPKLDRVNILLDHIIEYIRLKEREHPSDIYCWTKLLESQRSFCVDPAMDLYKGFICAVMVGMRVAWIAYLVRDEMPAMPARKTSILAGRIGGIKTFVVRIWIVLFFVAGAQMNTVNAQDGFTRLNILVIAHRHIGHATWCSKSNGLLLRLLLHYLHALPAINPTTPTPADLQKQFEMFQCYYCLYGTKVDSEVIDHASVTLPFEKDAAAEIMRAVAPHVLAKLDAKKGVRGVAPEIKACVDKIGEIYAEPPWEMADVHRNREIMNRMFEMPVDPLSIAPRRRGTSGGGHATPPLTPIPNPSLTPSPSSISPICFDIYYLQAKLHYATYQLRVGSPLANNYFDKAIESLQSTITQFQFDLCLSPERFDSWLSLGQCFSALVSEHLGHNAVTMREMAGSVRVWQQRAFQSFSMAVKLGRELGMSEERMLVVWSELGYLCYAIAAKPMNGVAGQSFHSRALKIWQERARQSRSEADSSINDGMLADPPSPDSSHPNIPILPIYALASYSFKKAALLDPTDWRYPYMLASTAIKLSRPHSIIINHFRTSIALVPDDSGIKEQEKILDPVIKFLGYLAKNLVDGRIEEREVRGALQGVKDSTGVISFSETNGFEGNDTNANASGDEGVVKSERDAAIDLIRDMLERIKTIDRKRWQHKHRFRLAWLEYHAAHSPQTAKTTLSTLVRIEDKTKTMIHFWKPEFERPAKHFLYAHKYTMFMILLLKETEDVEGLRRVCRKIRKAEDVLLWPDRVWRYAYNCTYEVLAKSIQGLHRTPLSGTMTKTEFDERAPEIETRMFATQDPKPPLLSAMLCAFDLKKLDEEFMDEEDLNLLLVELYSLLFVEFGGVGTGKGEVGRAEGEMSKVVFTASQASVGNEGGNINGLGDSSHESVSSTTVMAASASTTTNVSSAERVKFTHVLQRVLYVCKNPPHVKQDVAPQEEPAAAPTDLNGRDIDSGGKDPAAMETDKAVVSLTSEVDDHLILVGGVSDQNESVEDLQVNRDADGLTNGFHPEASAAAVDDTELGDSSQVDSSQIEEDRQHEAGGGVVDAITVDVDQTAPSDVADDEMKIDSSSNI